MLPCITFLAQDGRPVIIIVAAHTLDRPILLVSISHD